MREGDQVDFIKLNMKFQIIADSLVSFTTHNLFSIRLGAALMSPQRIELSTVYG